MRIAALVLLAAGASATLAHFDTGAVHAQEPLGEELQRVGSATLYLSSEEAIPWSGSSRVDERLHYAWYMVQDSSMKLVWNKPSGIKRAGGGFWSLSTEDKSDRLYDGDLDVRAIDHVRAVEIRSLVFNVWREPIATLVFHGILQLREDQDEGYNPRWFDLWDEIDVFGTSLSWVARVMLMDGTIIEADETPILEFARTIGDDVSAVDLVPDPREGVPSGDG